MLLFIVNNIFLVAKRATTTGACSRFFFKFVHRSSSWLVM